MLGCLSQSSGKWYKTASVVFKDSKEFPKYGITKVRLSVSLVLSLLCLCIYKLLHHFHNRCAAFKMWKKKW